MDLKPVKRRCKDLTLFQKIEIVDKLVITDNKTISQEIIKDYVVIKYANNLKLYASFYQLENKIIIDIYI